ncbi:MAG: TIGR03619 family F420-dependent LLM class oxidoreductase [Acidimicrobiia bacterium]
MARVDVSVLVSGVPRLFGDDLGAIVDLARMADDAGIDQLVLPDHVIMGPRTDRYPFGTFPYPPEAPWPEPLTTLAAMAAATTRVRLGTGILIVPLRPAVLLAKTAATLDVLSRGRLDLGVGTGWQREEFEAEGLDYSARVRTMDDTLRACRALWTQPGPVHFESPTLSFRDVWCEPRPVQPGGVPLWFGGSAVPATARRIAELGAGWLPIGVMPEDELGAAIELLRGALRDAGRDPSELGVRSGLPVVTGADKRVDFDATWAPVPALASLGVTAVSIPLGRFLRTRADVEPFFRDLAAAAGAA